MNILIKFPTRGRPDQFFNTLNKYISLAQNIDKIQFLITVDSNDISMNNEDVLKKLESMNVEYKIGNSFNKVHAVNRDVNEYHKHWDILLLASDDMVPEAQGYDEIIRQGMLENYPDTDGVLWFNDGYQKSSLNTLCILGRKYYYRFGYIYHPSYKSLWCDNEFMQISKILNKYAYFDQVIIRHQHPDFGFGQYDIIHEKNKQHDWDDQVNFNNRLKNNFYLGY